MSVRNHDNLDYEAVRQNKAVRELSRCTPANQGDFEPLETMLARVDKVTDGMAAVMQQWTDQKEN